MGKERKWTHVLIIWLNQTLDSPTVLRHPRRWRGGRVAEGAPLLREYGLIAHRGFESHPLRHYVAHGQSRRDDLRGGGRTGRDAVASLLYGLRSFSYSLYQNVAHGYSRRDDLRGAAQPVGTQSRPENTGLEVSPVLSAIITVPPIFSYVSDGVAVPTPSEASPQLHSNAADWI